MMRKYILTILLLNPIKIYFSKLEYLLVKQGTILFSLEIRKYILKKIKIATPLL